MKNFISTILFFSLITLSCPIKADTVDFIQLELNDLSVKTNSVFKQARETNDKVRENNPIRCVDFIESTDDGVLIQFLEGCSIDGGLSMDYILNWKINDQDYFSGGLFHTSCAGLTCKRTYRVDDRPFDEIAEAHRIAEIYASGRSYIDSISNIATKLYRQSMDKNKKITMKSKKFFGTEIPCSAEIVANAKEHTIKIMFPDVCPVPLSSDYKGGLKIKPKDLVDSMSAPSMTFGAYSIRKEKGKEICYTFETQCQDLTCIMREKNITCPAQSSIFY